MKKVDLVVVGAGPGGLSAARTAAQNGMSVVLVESKKDISKINRTCAQIFYLSHIGGGQTYIKPVKAEIGSDNESRFLFPDIGLSVDYNGPLRACYDWRTLSPNGTCVFTARNKLWGLVYNKGVLLESLLNEVKELAVPVLFGTTVLSVENTSHGVSVQTRDQAGSTQTIEAEHAVVANGINSRIVEQLGLNKQRKPLGGTIKLMGYVLEGVECPYHPSTWLTFTHPSITPFINAWMGPMAEGTWQLGTTAKKPNSPGEIMKTFLNDTHFAPWFKKAEIVWKTACVITPRYPIEEPVLDNIYIIGDAAAPAETWNQGALACGHQAVHSILEGDSQKYITWWKEAFLFNSPEFYKDLARYPALNMIFNDDDLNYLYGLMKDQLVSNVLDGILDNAERVQTENPQVYEKVKKIQEISLNNTFAKE